MKIKVGLPFIICILINEKKNQKDSGKFLINNDRAGRNKRNHNKRAGRNERNHNKRAGENHR